MMNRSNMAKELVQNPRIYDLRSLTVVMASFVFFMVLLESGGLVTWASRMDVGVTQQRWLSVLEPVEDVCESVGLTEPRRVLISAADSLGQSMRFIGDTVEYETGDNVDMESLIKNAAPAPLLAAAAPATAPAAPAAAKGPKTVVLVGDSMMAVGLAPNLVRSLEKDPGYTVIRAHKSATGLSRPEIFNWPDAIKAVTDKYKPDFIVVAIGGNDAQNVKYNGKVLKFNTPEWDQLYKQRVVEMAELFSKGNTRTLWVALPIMRSPSFRKNIDHINSLVRSATAAYPRIEMLDSTAAVTGKNREFASQLPDAKGRMVKMRAEDGIHLSDEGGKAIAELVLGWLRKK